MLLWIALIKYCLQAHQNTAETTPPVGMTDHHLGIIATPTTPTMIIGTDTASIILDPTHITLDTGVTAAMTHTGVAPDRFLDPHVVALHATGAPAPIATATTPHIADPHTSGFFPKMTVDPECINPTNTIINQHKDHLPVWKLCLGKTRAEGTNRSQLTTLPQNTIVQKCRIVTQRMIQNKWASPILHTWKGLPNKDTFIITHITDCPAVTTHAGKCYQELIDLGAAVSLLQYSTYKRIEDCYKTPIQPTTAKLNTADGSPMMTLGSTTLHLQIAEFKFTHNFIICDQLPDTELLLALIYRGNSHYLMLGTRTKTVLYNGMVNS